MNLLHFDSLGGASGDMLLGALVDLGIEAAALQRELATLPIGPFSIEAPKDAERHISGTRLSVHIPEHDHAGHHGRHLGEIRTIIEEAALPDPVKAMSLKAFGRLAEAEARVHGTGIEEVHFHEVGAVDAIVDIVGNCLALHWLKIEAVSFSPLPLGHGMIRCAHGTFPSPAPATAELLKGFPVEYVDEPHELVTPTGATLLTAWRSVERPPAGSRLLRNGYGFGHRKLDGRPNLIRATLLEAPAAGAVGETCLVLECNVDDTTPELLGALSSRLLEAGALDVFTVAAQMKKQRPGVLLTTLCLPGDRERLLDLVFRGCTTFGVREYLAARTMLERRFVEAQTDYGPVKIKIGRWRGEDITFAPEMEDCLRLARERNVSVRTVYEAASRARPLA
ncbi:MAG TPA: nickel pincer cofactor biosynthesis protein LarC [Kiritimatiellia bacterium]|nr:nickel pincer cofactor biosynthesis protein LarC [Kiritimatiellia bacterium]HRZ11179.1 nickel pincer cofactor biosynthesis protein LarC [Kiritimatiellia bacterium]HSA19030.1 nickel pincer cofactor biosynthesis protein LarC [Kiritimatiellia bacterium]